MELKEFKKIIKPIGLLDKDHQDFIESALIGNFNKWEQEQVNKNNVIQPVSNCTCVNDVGTFEDEQGKHYCSACEKVV